MCTNIYTKIFVRQRSNFIKTREGKKLAHNPPYKLHICWWKMAMAIIMRINMILIEGITTYFLTGLDMKAKGTTPWLLSDTVTCWFSFIFNHHHHHHHHHHNSLFIWITWAYHRLKYWNFMIYNALLTRNYLQKACKKFGI